MPKEFNQIVLSGLIKFISTAVNSNNPQVLTNEASYGHPESKDTKEIKNS